MLQVSYAAENHYSTIIIQEERMVVFSFTHNVIVGFVKWRDFFLQDKMAITFTLP